MEEYNLEQRTMAFLGWRRLPRLKKQIPQTRLISISLVLPT